MAGKIDAASAAILNAEAPLRAAGLVPMGEAAAKLADRINYMRSAVAPPKPTADQREAAMASLRRAGCNVRLARQDGDLVLLVTEPVSNGGDTHSFSGWEV